MEMRLQKFLSMCGLGSRRACERLIAGGRVKVNGSTVMEPGTRVTDGDSVSLDDKLVMPLERYYYVLNKPPGTLCVDRDSRGRTYVVDLIPGAREQGCFPVGRLDLDTTGLILITNDGELSNRIAHPRYNITKTYRAVVTGTVLDRDIKGMERGVALEDGSFVRDIMVLSIKRHPKGREVLLSIHEGRRHIVKRLFLALGGRVVELERTGIGGLRTEGFRVGRWKRLDADKLRKAIGMDR
ncbi:MAG: rRNA pseudouridine synthase [Candidatus Thermoplasmatota archaeon]|jgi:pseudouridine synthase|nr:rRNA pseudouridine synthase [Candidatus Thermoplasmatota archaeon]